MKNGNKMSDYNEVVKVALQLDCVTFQEEKKTCPVHSENIWKMPDLADSFQEFVSFPLGVLF